MCSSDLTVICVAEGAHAKGQGLTVAHHLSASPDPVRLGGVAEHLRTQLEPRLQSEVRTTQLGHLQRGGSATSHDRHLATLLGSAAADLVARGSFGHLVALRHGQCTAVPLHEVAGRTRPVPPDHAWMQAADALGVGFGV